MVNLLVPTSEYSMIVRNNSYPPIFKSAFKDGICSFPEGHQRIHKFMISGSLFPCKGAGGAG